MNSFFLLGVPMAPTAQLADKRKSHELEMCQLRVELQKNSWHQVSLPTHSIVQLGLMLVYLWTLEYACVSLCHVSLMFVFVSILTALKKEDTGFTQAIRLSSSSSCDSSEEDSSDAVSDSSSNTSSSEEDKKKKKRKKKGKDKKSKKSKKMEPKTRKRGKNATCTFTPFYSLGFWFGPA